MSRHPKQAASCSCFLSDVLNYRGATGIFALCFGSGVSLFKEEGNKSDSLLELEKYLLNTQNLL